KGPGKRDQDGEEDKDACGGGQLKIPAVHKEANKDQRNEGDNDGQDGGDMVPVEDALDKGLAIVRYIPGLFYGGERIDIVSDMHQPAFVELYLFFRELGLE